jgi:hypothetical protein
MDSPPPFMPTEYGNFDPSQWSNPYSSFQNTGIPFPASYLGWPTDSMGNPIQPTPGMTLNSTPQSAAGLPSSPAAGAAPAAAAPQASAGGIPASNLQQQRLAQLNAAPYNNALSSVNSGLGGWGSGGVSPSQAAIQQMALAGQTQALSGGMPQQQAAPAAAPAGPSSGLTAQQYLSLLAHPNPVTTPGATVPQSAQAYQPSNGVLANFLANWKPATSGPGSGFQQGFAKALRGS